MHFLLSLFRSWFFLVVGKIHLYIIFMIHRKRGFQLQLHPVTLVEMVERFLIYSIILDFSTILFQNLPTQVVEYVILVNMVTRLNLCSDVLDYSLGLSVFAWHVEPE